MGWPNVGIVVGARTTLVVDTGLGLQNGKIVAEAALKLAPTNRLVVTSTHFHPEHASGAVGFPADAWLIRNEVQEEEMRAHGEEMIHLFAGMKEQWQRLLVGVEIRPADMTFAREARINLGGGTTARLISAGPAHTRGDQLTFVEPDRTLISGDVVQNKVAPFIFGEGGTGASWIAAVDEAAKLAPVHVLPDHSPPGDGSLVAEERAFLVAVRERALALKGAGKTTDDASQTVTSEFKARYPDWKIDDLKSFVTAVYTE